MEVKHIMRFITGFIIALLMTIFGTHSVLAANLESESLIQGVRYGKEIVELES